MRVARVALTCGVCPAGNLVIKDKFIRRWVHKEGFSGFKRYVTAAEDKELEAKIAVVEKYNIRIPELVERIEKCHIEDLDFAGEGSGWFLPSHQGSRWSEVSYLREPTCEQDASLFKRESNRAERGSLVDALGAV